MGFLRSFRIYSLRLVALLPFFLLLPEVATAKDFVVTLDAGHGGKDYGAIGTKTNEKSITLAVVKRLGALIEKNLPEVKVVYTRDKDEYIQLNERAAIANKANSDLFISVHLNSADKRNRNRTNLAGCEVYTLGLHKTAENLAVAKRENSVIELEADHSEKYAGFDLNSLESDIVFELSQNKRLDQSIEFADAVHSELVGVAGRAPRGVRQAGFLVLWATSMPSVLVELDFICNPRAERFFLSDNGLGETVTALYNAFCAYLNTYGAQVTGKAIAARAIDTGKHRQATHRAEEAAATVADEAPAQKETGLRTVSGHARGALAEIDSDTDTPRYYVQILATSDRLAAGSSELKGVNDVEYYRDGGMFKYAVDAGESLDDAQDCLKRLRKKFPQCFIIKMVKGRRVDFIKP